LTPLKFKEGGGGRGGKGEEEILNRSQSPWMKGSKTWRQSRKNLRELKRVVWNVALLYLEKRGEKEKKKAGKNLRPGGGKQTALGLKKIS
jgi:hypothetical protein